MSRAPAAGSGLPSRSAPTSQSPLVAYALSLVERYAPINRPVLLVGPVGCGKTWLAAELHRRSGRSGRFVALSSGATSEELYRDQLFGHVAGAFTGAVAKRLGLIDRAECGTLLLDDLALMEVGRQTALLDVLVSARFYPIGSPEERTSAARFLFASTQSLPELIARGALLPDLASRIGEFVIHLPSLAQRRGDITSLAVDAVIRFQEEHRRSRDVQFATDCLALLHQYSWPGNIRELIQVVELAAAEAWTGRTPVVIDIEHLPERFRRPFEPARTAPVPVAVVAEALKWTGGNQTAAARLLGAHRNTIRRKANKIDVWRGAPASGAPAPGRGAVSQDAGEPAARHNPSPDNENRGS